MKVSAVIPAYNEEEFIEDCLIALKKQTYPIDEIIVIDSGSTDRTVEIAKKYADKILFGKRHIGYNRELGINATKNNIILSTDADTIMPENWVEEAIKYLDYPEVVGVVGSIKPLNPSLITNINCWFRNTFFSEYSQRCACLLFRKPPGSSFYSPNCRPLYGEFSVLLENLQGIIIYDKNLVVLTDIPEKSRVKTFFLITLSGACLYLFQKSLFKPINLSF